MALHGDLFELAIGELLQTLTLNNHEGTLKIHTEKDGDRYFYISKGEIQLVSPGKKGTRIGELLLKANKLGQTDLTRALEQNADTGEPLGKTLVDMQLISEEDIEQVIHQQFREEFFEIFLLTKGAFEFFFRTRPDQLIQFDPTVARVSVNASSVMLEALRQIDEWQVMSKTITTPRAILKVVAENVAEVADEVTSSDDVKQAVPLVDGKSAVAEIVEKTPGTKFDVYNLLYQLIKREAIRPLTHEECKDQALGAETANDTYAATLYYEFGTYLDPDDVEMRERQFQLLKRLKVYKEARDAALAVGDKKLEGKEFEKALEYYEEAQACDEKDLRAAEGIFRASLQLGKDTARTTKAGDELVKIALRHHDVKRARDALTALLELEPFGHRRRIQLADLEEDTPEGKARAIELYDQVIEECVRPEDAAFKAEASRKLVALDARRSDVQTTLKEAVATQESLEKRRVRNIVLANAVGLLLILAAYLASYELGGRSAFADAEHEAQAAGDDAARLAGAIDAFRYVARAYPRSTVATPAEVEANKLRERMAAASAEAEKRRQAELAQKQATEEETRRQRAIDLLRHAEVEEKKGSYREAAEAKLEVVRDYAAVVQKLDQRVQIAIPITTAPPGARIRRGAEDLGTTPGVIFADPLKETAVRVELPGYVPRDLTFKVDRFEEAKLTLERTALWTVKTEGAIDAAPVLASGRVYAASRDGNLYAIDAASGAVAWKQRMGEYGDQVTPPGFAAGKCFAASTDAAVQALDPATGKRLWTLQVDGAVRAQVGASPDEALVAVPSASGAAHFLKAANGEEVFSVRTDQRLDAPVAFGPGRAYIASRDAHLYAVDLAKGTVVWRFRAGDDFLAPALVTGDLVVIGSRDGSVHAIDAASGKELWRQATAGRIRGAPARSGALCAVGSEDGKLHAFDVKTGTPAWRFTADGPLVGTPAVTDRWIYVVSTLGTVFRVDPERGTSEWKFPIGASAAAGAVVDGGRIYVGGADGGVRAILE